jgi:hypothetical protein
MTQEEAMKLSVDSYKQGQIDLANLIKEIIDKALEGHENLNNMLKERIGI